ncbi:hypothetical protein T07_2139 [Trichinella nelsoni]|uniref:Uncharacterized protein n=1 Tax=Trichinella nelsoni TaxID=6336 RepID=A0A0V0RDQ3_9BILA|nr:hypothetical protein T07_2139 [Trichinella nelsoni]
MWTMPPQIIAYQIFHTTSSGQDISGVVGSGAVSPPLLVFTKEISLAVIKAAISSSRGRVTLLTGAILVLLITNFTTVSPDTTALPYAISDASPYPCNSTSLMQSVPAGNQHLGSLISDISGISAIQSRQSFSIFCGRGVSQSTPLRHSTCNIRLALTKNGERYPNGSKIFIITLNSPLFVICWSGLATETIGKVIMSSLLSHTIPSAIFALLSDTTSSSGSDRNTEGSLLDHFVK